MLTTIHTTETPFGEAVRRAATAAGLETVVVESVEEAVKASELTVIFGILHTVHTDSIHASNALRGKSVFMVRFSGEHGILSPWGCKKTGERLVAKLSEPSIQKVCFMSGNTSRLAEVETFLLLVFAAVRTAAPQPTEEVCQ